MVINVFQASNSFPYLLKTTEKNPKVSIVFTRYRQRALVQNWLTYNVNRTNWSQFVLNPRIRIPEILVLIFLF